MKDKILDYVKSVVTDEVILAAIVAIEHVLVAKYSNK